jgi:micrococcal nuclease
MRITRFFRSLAVFGLALLAFAAAIATKGGIGLYTTPSKVSIAIVSSPKETGTPSSPKKTVFVRAATSTVAANATVTHVVDGDTLDVKIDGGEEARIRLLGVNTPEVVDPRKPVECFGKEASAFTKSLLAAGARVRVNADPQADERDKYGRLLRNIVLEDGTDLNATLVASGYAQAYLSFPLNPERKRQITKLQNEAKASKRGMWAPDACAK